MKTGSSYFTELQGKIKELEEEYGEAMLKDGFKFYMSSKSEEEVAKNWKTHCLRYGLREDELNKKFLLNGEMFILKGIKPRNRKYPIIAEKMSNGRDYKIAPHEVIRSLRSEGAR